MEMVRGHSDALDVRQRCGVVAVGLEPSWIRGYCQQLTSLEVDVTVLSSVEAEDWFAEGIAPEVVIIDASGGTQFAESFCQRLRAELRLSSAYILVVVDEGDSAAHYLSRGADSCLRRQFAEKRLKSSVRAALRSQAYRRGLNRRERRRAIDWLGSVVAHELNNPLAAAISALQCMGQVLHEPLDEAGVAELREMVSEGQELLGRLGDFSRRLIKKPRLSVGGSEVVTTDDLIRRVVSRLTPLGRTVTTSVGQASEVEAALDATMLLDALSLVAEEAVRHCSGGIDVSIQVDRYRFAVLLEIGEAPDSDAAALLEPRLTSHNGCPARYDPGLSDVEDGFARFGGQIFARSHRGRWRFGLTLPVVRED